jgi:hypothetical protein
MRNPVVNILLATLAACLAGCIDANPSTFYVDAGLEVGPPDDVDRGDVDPDADPFAACRACFAAPEDPGPGCGGPSAACSADAKCTSIQECAITTACYTRATQAEVIDCVLPCFVANGVTNLGDPVLMLTNPLLPCALGPCQPACKGGP